MFLTSGRGRWARVRHWLAHGFHCPSVTEGLRLSCVPCGWAHIRERQADGSVGLVRLAVRRHELGGSRLRRL